ncbi:MAG: NAD-dependent epimerase/dehydratase family protein [Nitrospirae bacterium]|nr:NAD-dependent epimerase/dehydratase family protein [Nitrospirota bacterium]
MQRKAATSKGRIQGRTILVAGGAGFIGANICFYLKKKHPSCRIISLDNLKRRGSEINIELQKNNGIEFIHGDVRCKEDLKIGHSIDAIIECSAEPSVVAGYGENPEYILNTNLLGAINCFELARNKGADVIFLSTSRVYPYELINSLPFIEKATRYEFSGNYSSGVREDFPIVGPKTLYGATKLASEQILVEYMAQYGIKGVINRCGTVAGPGQFGKVDQGVFTYWIMAHLSRSPLQYIGFGGSGKQVRDLLHVDDLCRLIELQLLDMDVGNQKIFNVGGGKANTFSLLEATLLCERISGRKVRKSRIKETRSGDVRIYYTDIKNVETVFRWKPEKSAEKIMSDIYEWLKAIKKA